MESSTRNQVQVSAPERATYVAVVGPGDDATRAEAKVAREVGRLLAERDVIVVCGGLGGVMAAVCQGAHERGGLTVGLLPGRDRAAAALAGNHHLSVALATGMGELRNGLVVAAADAVIAIGGSWGTLSEIALALRTEKPTIVIGGWTIDDPAHGRTGNAPGRAGSAKQAVDQALQAAAAGQRRAT